MSYKLISLIASFLIAALMLSSMAPAAYGESIPAGVSDTQPDDSSTGSDSASMNDIYFYTGLGAGSAVTGVVAGTITAQAVTEYFQSVLVQRAVVAGYEGAGLSSQLAYAHVLASCGGIATGIAVGFAIVGIALLIGYLCYS